MIVLKISGAPAMWSVVVIVVINNIISLFFSSHSGTIVSGLEGLQVLLSRKMGGARYLKMIFVEWNGEGLISVMVAILWWPTT